MPFPMVGMTMTIMTQQYYGNYALAGALTAVQAIAGAVLSPSPVLGTLVDRFGQRAVSIPTIVVWMVAATSFVSCVLAHANPVVLYCIVPFLAAVPPWGAMSRARWTYLMGNNRQGVNRALSLSGVFDEAMWVVGNPLASTLAVISGVLSFSVTGLCVLIGAWTYLMGNNRQGVNRALSLSGVFDEAMWVVGNPLASTLAVISGVLSFSVTGLCVLIGALMFLTEFTTCPPSQTPRSPSSPACSRSQ